MSLHKRSHVKKLNHPCPFSAYVIKSYSTQNSKQSLQEQPEQQSLKQLHQYLNVLEINSKIQKSTIVNKSTEFRRTDSMFRNKAVQSPLSVAANILKIPAINPMRDQAREKQSRVKVKSLSPVKKMKITENKRIIASLRYQMVSLYNILGRREDYMIFLRGKTELLSTPLKTGQIEQKLAKYEQTRGKDKGRVKFNYITNDQLRSLKYKAKNAITYTANSKKQQKQKVHYDQDEQCEQDQTEQKQQVIDFQTWKRRNGVGYNQKVFIIKGGYVQLRRTLIERGWYENEDVWSPYYDFKWTTRICDINFMVLKHSQGVNHFNNNHHLTSKYGITRRLRTLALGYGVDSDKFYPKCFDLGDQVDFQNFVQNFKYSFAQSVAKRFLVDKKRYKGLELKIRIMFEIMKKKALTFLHTINSINKGLFLNIAPDQWTIITETAQMEEDQIKKKLLEIRKIQKNDISDPQNPEDETYEDKLYEKIDQKIRKYLQDINERDPQFQINGMRNVWIAKPNFMSRGRGIRCFNNIYDIADYCLGQPTQFVVQKYIQNPLLIQGRKFDIRQWVLIQDFNPPKIWFYEQCYLRFSNEQYSMDNIYNRFVHLTNNSIQKHSKKHNAQKSMWQMGEFSQWLGDQKWRVIQQKMRNIVVWSIKSCEGHVIGKKGSSELVGYDFMIDQNLNPWLIQINMSPSMDYSTPVTKKLVKMVLQDTGKILSGGKKGKNVGNFTCIYKSSEDLAHFNLYNI